MNRIDVPGTLREMWDTKPARPRNDRQVAGVASAIARRYDIDPVLVRVGFIVTAFLGIGAILYIAGWIALPEEPLDPAAPPGPPQRGIMTVAVVVAGIVTVVTFFRGDNRGDSILALLVVAGLLFLLHHSRGHRGVQAGVQAPVPPAPGSPAAGPSLVKDTSGATTTPVAAAQAPVPEPALTPPAWDPLGAAPFAWDLPEPGPAYPPAPPVAARRRPPVTAVTLGLALLGGGLTAVILLFNHALTVTNAEIVAGVVLAVLGAGLVVGGLVRAGRGLIPFAVLMSMLTWGLLAAPTDAFHNGVVGELHAAPASVAELAPTYERAAGEVRLDLRKLDLTVPAGGIDTPVHTAISVGAGAIEVLLPANADVTLNASTGAGSVDFPGRSSSGPGAEVHVTEDLGADGVRAGRLLVLDIEEGLGDVEVRRG